MDTAQRLADLTEACAWVTDPAEAARILPSFSEDVPGFISGAGQRTDGRPSWPIGCVPVLAGPLAAMLATAGLAAARDDGATRVDQLGEDALAADPLVVACGALLREAAVPGLRAHAAPAVAIAWAAPRMLRGDGAQVPGLTADELSGLNPLVTHLTRLSPADRGAALQRVCWEISGRLGAAVADVARSGLSIPAGGLLRILTTNRLLLAYPRGTLDQQPALDEVSGLLGAGLDARLAGAAVQAMSAVLAAVGSRQVSGSPDGLDLALLAHVSPREEPMRALLHPVAGPLALGSLAGFVGARDLKKAGIDAGTAKALLKPSAHRALAAAWGDIRGPLQEWDLLSTLIDRVLPLSRAGGGWSVPGGALRASARWELLVPAGRGQDDAFVVAVRLTELRGAVGRAARSVRGLDAAGAVERAWTDLVAEASADVSTLVADHGLAAFASCEAAVEFALRAAAALSGPREVLAGPRMTRVTVPEGIRASVGVARGVLRGGTDGERSVLGGDAVASALGLSGSGGLSGRAADRSGLRRVMVGPDGLRSEGVLVQGGIAEQQLAELRQAGAPLHLRGESTTVGGLGADFKAAPVLAWWDSGKAGVVVFVGLDTDTDTEGPVELLAMDPSALSTFHAVDLEQARLDAVEPVRDSGGGKRHEPEHDPFASDTTALFTRPLAAAGAHEPVAQTRTVEAEPAYEGLEPSNSFMGVGGFGGSGSPSLPGGDASDIGESAAHAILAGGDEFTDDDLDDDLDGPGVDLLGAGASDDAEGQRMGRLAVADEDEPEPSAPMLLDEPDPEAGAPREGLGGVAFSFSGGGGAAEVEIEDDWGDEDDASVDWAAAVADGVTSREAELDMLQSGATDDMDLVGVAGFSLQTDTSDVGTEGDPLADPGEHTGFFNESGGSVPAGQVDRPSKGTHRTRNLARPPEGEPRRAEADPEPTGSPGLMVDAFGPPDGSTGGTTPVDGAMIAELMRTFRGYVVLEDEGEFTFGLREGSIIRDAHSFDTGGDEAAAYRSFLQAKVDAGFIPRLEQVVALAPGVAAAALDDWRLQHAYQEVGR